MNTPDTGFSAVYTQSPIGSTSMGGTCPGGTGCSVGTDAGFSALPQVYNAFSGSNTMAPAAGSNNMSLPWNQGMAVTPENLQYLNGFIRTQIGKKVKVEFLIGANTLSDRIGVLVGVGANYILLNEIETDDLLACDFYNIKFIRFYY